MGSETKICNLAWRAMSAALTVVDLAESLNSLVCGRAWCSTRGVAESFNKGANMDVLVACQRAMRVIIVFSQIGRTICPDKQTMNGR
jgi:hypothetical protein